MLQFPIPFPQGSTELVPEHETQLAVGTLSQGQAGGHGDLPHRSSVWGHHNSDKCHPMCPLQILMPALMVTAGKDVVLFPSMSKGMEEWVRVAPSQSRWGGDASVGAPMGMELWGWELCWDMGWGVGCGELRRVAGGCGGGRRKNKGWVKKGRNNWGIRKE